MMNTKDKAKRVKGLFDQACSTQDQGKEEKMQPHDCKQIKSPKLPDPVSFPHLLKKISDRKTSAVNPEWNEESKQAHDVGTHVEQQTSTASDLIPQRVKRWKIKECQEIARKIKALSKQKEAPGHHKVELLDDKPKTNAHEDRKQDELWQEMMKSKEERQFQIGRITTYFS